MEADNLARESTSIAVGQLNVEFGGFSTAGIKAVNQDAFAARQPSPSERTFKGVAAAIADGLSCSERSAEASQMCVTHFIEDYYSTPDTWSVKTSASRVLNALNTWLVHHGNTEKSASGTMATTLSAVIFKSTSAHLFHIGDSRIYRLRNNQLEQLTQDHSQTHPTGHHQLTNAIGINLHLQVDYVDTDLLEGDIFLLTTDGIHDFLSTGELEHLANPASDSLESQAQAIVNHALSKGSHDNLSCLLAHVKAIPAQDLVETHRQLAKLVIPPVLKVGMTIDGYRVIDVLHSGTRSHLYRVKNEFNGEMCVLKAPSENYADDAHYLEAFIREQWIGKRIRHPHVVKVYSRPQNTRFLYNISEYVEGQELRQWMHDHPSPPLEEVRNVLEQIASALRAFQRMSMLHRDLKPENIMISSAGHVKLIDFGTVQVSGLQEISSPLNEPCPVGSVSYIAPEYLMNQRGQYRSDIFSLGVIVYEMLCGKLPFKQHAYRHTSTRRYEQWRHIPITQYRKDIPAWIDAALNKATAPNPDHRYAALSEFTQDMKVPNKEETLKLKQAPLIERYPTRVWQIVSLLLLLLLIYSNLTP